MKKLNLHWIYKKLPLLFFLFTINVSATEKVPVVSSGFSATINDTAQVNCNQYYYEINNGKIEIYAKTGANLRFKITISSLAVGEYDFGDADNSITYYHGNTTKESAIGGESGALIITSISNNQITGNFSFTCFNDDEAPFYGKGTFSDINQQ